jgi:hypothetical protein
MKKFSGFRSPLKQTEKEKKELLDKQKWIKEEEKRKPFKEEWHKDYFYKLYKSKPIQQKKNIA